MRREKELTITAEGRDNGKRFKLVELSAFKAEKWAARALNALISSGIELPAGAADAGMAGFASAAGVAMNSGMSGGFSWPLIEPLLDEMLSCVYVSTPIRPQAGQVVTFRPMIQDADDIEEISTLLMLRREVLELHLGFSMAELLPRLKSSLKGNGQSEPAAPASPAQ